VGYYRLYFGKGGAMDLFSENPQKIIIKNKYLTISKKISREK
jgi:hypothetical protein